MSNRTASILQGGRLPSSPSQTSVGNNQEVGHGCDVRDSKSCQGVPGLDVPHKHKSEERQVGGAVLILFYVRLQTSRPRHDEPFYPHFIFYRSCSRCRPHASCQYNGTSMNAWMVRSALSAQIFCSDSSVHSVLTVSQNAQP